MYLSVPRLTQKKSAIKSYGRDFTTQTRNLSKLIKRQHDACNNIQLPDEVERQLRLLFKQHSKKKLLNKKTIDVVHINNIRQVCIAVANNVCS